MAGIWDKLEDWVLTFFVKKHGKGNRQKSAGLREGERHLPVRVMSETVASIGTIVESKGGYPRINLWVSDDGYSCKFSYMLDSKLKKFSMRSYFYENDRLQFYFKCIDLQPYHPKNEMVLFDTKLDLKNMCEVYSMKPVAIKDMLPEARDKAISLYNSQVMRCLEIINGSEPIHPNTIGELSDFISQEVVVKNKK